MLLKISPTSKAKRKNYIIVSPILQKAIGVIPLTGEKMKL